jgi:polyvinyl alcohol dehydrogenase (cytochrome)
VNKVLMAAAAAALSLSATAALAFFQDEHGALPGGGGRALFETKCKTCHDPAQGRAPDRAALRQRSPEQVVQALTRGSMNPMAAGLTPAMIGQIAEYVTGKTLAAGAAGQTPLQAGVQPPDNLCTDKAPPIRQAAADWNGWGKTAGGWRYQAATSITPKNVERLKVKWAFSMAGGRTGQPTVVGDWIFFGTFAGDVYALDARTGCVRWRKAGVGPVRTSAVVEHRPGASKSGWVLYFADHVRDFWALDAQTGAELWKLNLDAHPLAMLTGSPAIAGDVVYQPISSSEENMGNAPNYSCCTFAGKVVAIDLKAHKVLWKTALLDPKPSRKNSAGTQQYGPAGAGIWDQPVIDAKRGQLYVTTGDSYTDVEEHMSDAIVAIGLKDGKLRWATQVTAKDAFLIGCPRGVNCPQGVLGPDHDFGASPILASLPGGKQVVLAGQKSGMTYGIDPDTGKKLWEQRVGAGSALGGVEWGMAFDGRRLYAAASDAAARSGAKPGLTALDPATGKIVWQDPAPKVPCSWPTRRCVNAQSAATTAVPGLVFQGGHDGWLRAYFADTGRTAWMFDSAGRTYATVNGVQGQPGGSFDHSGPVVSGGMVYAVSGYNGATGAYGNPLNVLLAFSVDGK